MKKHFLLIAAAFALPAIAQDAEPPVAPSPNEIVDLAPADEWVSIPADDLLVMTLAPDRDGNPRSVTIQLMPAPFSQGWVENIRTFARAKWYDNISVNRVQDNYVVQWGDPNYDNPEAEGEPRALPEGLKVMDENEYTSSNGTITDVLMVRSGKEEVERISREGTASIEYDVKQTVRASLPSDPYAEAGAFFSLGWPMASEDRELESEIWPVHCYGMVGVGRGYSPDTGSGAELYTVIGHAPRHLDRNIALVGRIIEGMEHLSSLPRGSGALGFYTEDELDKRTPILSVRVVGDMPESERPTFEYLSTEGMSFAKYAEARANRRDPFFIVPAGGADICNIPVPVRRVVKRK